MILGNKQRLTLAALLREGVGFGRMDLETFETSRGRGNIVLSRQGWANKKLGYVVKEQIKIGAGGKITRTKFNG